MVTSNSPTFCVPPFPIGLVWFSNPLLPIHKHVSKIATICGLCCFQARADRRGDPNAHAKGRSHPAWVPSSDCRDTSGSSSPTDRSTQPVRKQWSVRTCCGRNMLCDCPSCRACCTSERECTGTAEKI